MKARNPGPIHRGGCVPPTPADEHSGSAPADLTDRIVVPVRYRNGRLSTVEGTLTREQYLQEARA